MTEREIELLGFERFDEEDLYNKSYHYYSYSVVMGLQFITNSSNEIEEEGEWYVELFDTDPTIRFYNFEEVQSLLNLLERRFFLKPEFKIFSDIKLKKNG